jgi:ParB family chromosome partitioning protein
VAQIIAGSNLWEVKAEPQKANSDAIRDSLAANKANDSYAIERDKVRALLDDTEDEPDTIVPLNSEWHRIPNLHAIFAKLIALDDEAVTRILTFVAAETLPSSTALVEILGNLFNVDMANHWQPDDTFFDLLRDKQAINAMLQQIGGKNVAEGNITATAKVQKQIIKDYLDGTRKPQQSDWQPDYMQFPMQAYTDKGGIGAIANWNEANPYFE